VDNSPEVGLQMEFKRLKFALQSTGAVISLIVVGVGSSLQDVKPADTGSDLLVFNVCVTHKSGATPVMELTEKDFSVLVDNQPAKIDYFSGRDIPESVGVLVDTSGSMRNEPRWRTAVSQLSRFVVLSNPGSEFLLLTFGGRPEIVADWTSERATLAGAIARTSKAEPKGPTALFDTLTLALNKAAQAKSEKKFILLITDGIDNTSKARYQQARRLLEESRIPVYCIALTNPVDDALGGGSRSRLEELCSVSGGAVFFPGSPKEATLAIDLVAVAIRHGYRIGLTRLSLPKDSKYHKFTVKVSPVRAESPTEKGNPYTVGAPKGFWASK
jgi:Ca-activated chloride channel family protein